MTSTLCALILLLSISLVYCHSPVKHWYPKNRLKPECRKNENVEDRLAFGKCWFIEGMKSWFRRTSISWFPGKTKKWNLTEITSHCNSYYVCMENTKCYKDYVLFETLDRCAHDAFSIGPMSFCTKKLKEVQKSTTLASCVVDYLENKSPRKWTCQSAKSLGDCLMPAAQKYCEPELLPILQEHQSARQYYLGCDGRLKFKDLDRPTNSSSDSEPELEIP